MEDALAQNESIVRHAEIQDLRTLLTDLWNRMRGDPDMTTILLELLIILYGLAALKAELEKLSTVAWESGQLSRHDLEDLAAKNEVAKQALAAKGAAEEAG
jgi:hypothetical protein